VQEYPGRTAVVWPPHALRGGQAAKNRLAEAADEQLARREIVMAQAPLPAHDDRAAAALVHVGFAHLTQLEYMVATPRSARSDLRISELRFAPYDAREHARLAALVEATYDGADDCPELNGVRDVHDVLIGYQSTGTFDPAKWFIVSHGGRDVGVLLLAEHAPPSQWEIVYMALVPRARKQGLGTRIVYFAFEKALAAGIDSVLLAVDARNEPALRLYRHCGFRTWDQRIVYWKRYAREISLKSTP
jgi:ribosomal protein S18 acetylase RimI-like enzyme